MLKTALLVLALLLPFSAQADLQQYLGANPVKIGGGKFYYKGLIHIYDAALYSTDGIYDAAKPFAIELTYKTDIDGDDIADNTLEKINKITPVSKEKSELWLAEMKKIFPETDDGMVLDAVSNKGKSVVFLKNGVNIGEIKDAEFTGDFFGIWLSLQTSEPDLRRKLLGEDK